MPYIPNSITFSLLVEMNKSMRDIVSLVIRVGAFVIFSIPKEVAVLVAIVLEYIHFLAYPLNTQVSELKSSRIESII